MQTLMEKLQILADSAKYDVSCSSSGSHRKNTGNIGNAHTAGICHSWSADGRCISLLKVLFSNKCVYNCEYCVNRRSNDFPRASFEPDELARLTIEFYRRNYIEGLFLSSAVEVSPDHTAERILESLRLLRYKYGFSGYIHAKIIPGVSQELLHEIGLVADRLSVNIEMPTARSLQALRLRRNRRRSLRPCVRSLILLSRGTLSKAPAICSEVSPSMRPEHYLKGFPRGSKRKTRQVSLGQTAIHKTRLPQCLLRSHFPVTAAAGVKTSLRQGRPLR